MVIAKLDSEGCNEMAKAVGRSRRIRQFRILFTVFMAGQLSYAFAADVVTPFNTEQAAGAPMPAEEVCKTAALPPGFRLSVFAAEPEVQNPIAITMDDRGRLWVAENYTWAGARAGDFDTRLHDRIVILEDSDGDGRMDKRTVFWDKAERLTSIEVGFGGVWALCAPQLLFIPDKDRDDKPDGEPTVMLDGFDLKSSTHTVANGLKWGPDGWLYGRQGILGTSQIGPPDADKTRRVTMNTGVWRYHPVRKKCEVAMHGMTNPWGFDYDSNGEIFVTNTVIGHLWHVVDGARTERMAGTDFNPHAYQLLSQVADHVHWDTHEVWQDVRAGVTDSTSAAGGGHAHTGLLIYQGDNWPAEYRGRAFTLNIHGRRINCDQLKRGPVEYMATHGADMCFIKDTWFRGMDLISGPDGGVYIADWTDTGECHDVDGVHRTSGRIYKLTYGGPPKTPAFDLQDRSDAELAELQLHANDWYTRHARRLLQERAAEGKIASAPLREHLLAIFQGDDEPARLKAFWALYLSNLADEKWLIAQLTHPDERVRAWGVKFLIEMRDGRTMSGGETVSAFQHLAKTETSGLVLLHLASALQRLSAQERWPIGLAIAEKKSRLLADDRTLSIMLWLALEPCIANNPEYAIELERLSAFPLIQENVARRIGLETDQDLSSVELLLDLAAQEARLSRPVIAGMMKALAGRNGCPTPTNWMAVKATLAKQSSDENRLDLAALGVAFQDADAIRDLKNIVREGQLPLELKNRALQLLLTARPHDLGAMLLQLATQPGLAVEAIKGLARYDDPEFAEKLIDLYASLAPEAKAAAIDTLASRLSFARLLLNAIEEKQIPVADVSPFHARQIVALGDKPLKIQLRKVWGDLRTTPAEKKLLIDAYEAKMTPAVLAAADFSNGKAIYSKTCAACHTLHGVGGKVGPDLTGSNRKDSNYLLENLLDPSAVVPASFRATVFLMDDGRVVSGVIREQNDRTVTVETQQGRQVLDRQNIEHSNVTDASLMPDGLFQGLSDAQVRDLLGFLMK